MSKKKYDYLHSLSTHELVNVFNGEASHRSWVGERAIFLRALVVAFKSKGVSLENIERKENGLVYLSLRYPVFLKEGRSGKILIPILQS